jgi:transcriptional repressor NrdR
MKCPYCRRTASDVYNSRITKFGAQTWRRRRCRNCGKSFTTYEAIDLSFLRVTSTASRKDVPYNRAKLFSSLYQTFLDVPHKAATIDAVTDTIEAKLLDLQRPVITSADIARLTLTTLKHFNTAAFLRYLATHAEFTTQHQLATELKKY